jgi:hypothetical protein
METLESALAQLSPAHVRLAKGLLNKGLTYNGCVRRGEKLMMELKSGCSEVIFHSDSGSVELFTENINSYEPYDDGQHEWTVWPEDPDDEVDMMVGIITRITGDD